ncbi:PREDICTED: DNA repair protein XRCC2 [Rhagoletis zephyria]|uniref:DNA repair protein XRCC2 n=1 Tax=Rhagoletis zephyria TaxID=28612 RepID=UPI000811A714|nr:PREDICTED: DNA repair protein XRCC2 [Rhagoletis zephyria]
MNCKIFNAFEGCMGEIAYRRPTLHDLDTEVFANDAPLSKSLTEISGPAEAGKSMLLWRLMARCLAPTYFGGRNCDIIFIDLRHKFDIEHFQKQIRRMVVSSTEQHTATELEEVVEKCLDSIHWLSCYSSNHFDAALETADILLMKHPDCALIAIDGLDAFYWLDTYARRIRMQTHYSRNVDRLRSLCDRHSVCCAYTVDTNYINAKRAKGTDANALGHPPLPTNVKVEHRLHLELRKNGERLLNERLVDIKDDGLYFLNLP